MVKKLSTLILLFSFSVFAQSNTAPPAPTVPSATPPSSTAPPPPTAPPAPTANVPVPLPQNPRVEPPSAESGRQTKGLKPEFISRNELIEDLQSRSIVELCGDRRDFHVCYFKTREDCFEYVHEAFDTCVASWNRSKKNETKIPFDRAELYRNSMNNCIENVYSKKPPKNMNIDDNKCVNLFMKHANKHSNFEALYLLKTMEAQRNLDSLQEQIDNSDRSICPGFTGGNYSACFGDYLNRWTPITIAEVSILGIMVTNIASRDRTLLKERTKENNNEVILSQIRNLYLILDRIDVSKFYISGIVPKAKDLNYKLNQLKADDQKKINEATWKIIYTVEELFKDFKFDVIPTGKKKTKDAAKNSLAQLNQINDVKNRLESYKMKRWKY